MAQPKSPHSEPSSQGCVLAPGARASTQAEPTPETRHSPIAVAPTATSQPVASLCGVGHQGGQEGAEDHGCQVGEQQHRADREHPRPGDAGCPEQRIPGVAALEIVRRRGGHEGQCEVQTRPPA